MFYHFDLQVKSQGKVLLSPALDVLVWVEQRVPFYWMTSSDCIRGWEHCDLQEPLTTGKPFTGNHLALHKYLIIFNGGSAKNLPTVYEVIACVCVEMHVLLCLLFVYEGKYSMLKILLVCLSAGQMFFFMSNYFFKR